MPKQEHPLSYHRGHILSETRIMSDMWKAYDCLKDDGYVQLTVNDSLNFLDADKRSYNEN